MESMSMAGDNSRVVRVLVADDSGFMRAALTRMIESDPGLRVVGTAQTGIEALEKIAALQPDVVTLDVEMPKLNGIETLRRIMRECPRPVIMVSSLTQEGAETTLEALAIGAFDCLPKTISGASHQIEKIRQELVAKLKAAGESHRVRPQARVVRPAPSVLPVDRTEAFCPVPSIIAIGTSTGGPKALQEILPLLPADLPVGIVIVQHMPAGFTGPFARRLDNLSKIAVREAANNDTVEPGVIYIAPAGIHLTVHRSSVSKTSLRLSQHPPNMLHVPSVDVMMLSVAEAFRGLAMGIIMTGMGADGALGMQAIAREGGLTVGQDERTCTVYGMPRACAELGVLKRTVPLLDIPKQILQATKYRKRSDAAAHR